MMRALVAVGMALLLVPAYAAAVTPTAPANGATGLGEHPTFTWTLDGDEVSAVNVSRQQRTTPAGEFYDEDRVDTGLLTDTSTSWAPTYAIAAGSYWWSVSWHTPDYDATGHTAPMSFSIPTRLRAPRIVIAARYSFTIAADVSWWSNTSSARVVAEVRVGTRRAGRAVRTETDLRVAARNTADYLGVSIPAWARGKRGTYRATITAGGRTTTVSRAVVIPAE